MMYVSFTVIDWTCLPQGKKNPSLLHQAFFAEGYKWNNFLTNTRGSWGLKEGIVVPNCHCSALRLKNIDWNLHWHIADLNIHDSYEDLDVHARYIFVLIWIFNENLHLIFMPDISLIDVTFVVIWIFYFEIWQGPTVCLISYPNWIFWTCSL